MNAQDIMLAAHQALERAGIRSVLVGSFSSNYYGIPRSTQDVDFVLAVEDLPVSDLARHLGSEFHLDPQASFESITLSTRYEVSHRDSAFKIDLFLLRSDAHDQLAFDRRVPGSYGDRTIYVPSPEDVVVTKLRWSKSGRRNKDIDDVRGVLAVQQGRLDLAYIRRWTSQHGTRELFEQLLGETTTI